MRQAGQAKETSAGVERRGVARSLQPWVEEDSVGREEYRRIAAHGQYGEIRLAR